MENISEAKPISVSVLGIRYGKYCGIGYFGCPGEPPCDDLDDCCMTHDNCVDLKGKPIKNIYVKLFYKQRNTK